MTDNLDEILVESKDGSTMKLVARELDTVNGKDVLYLPEEKPKTWKDHLTAEFFKTITHYSPGNGMGHYK